MRLSILLLSLLLVPSAFAASTGLLDAADTTTELYATENKIDLSKPHSELYGYSSERHGGFARTRIFKTSEPKAVEPKAYACEFSPIDGSPDEQTTCWKQKPTPSYSFEASPVRASVDDMQKSATEVARLMTKAKNSEHAEFTLLKVWPEANGIQVQLGYEVEAIEENYVCQTHPKLSCVRATSVPIYEP